MADQRDVERELLEKYAIADLGDHPTLTRSRFLAKLQQRDLLDQHFAKASLVDFQLAAGRRPVLDTRTRLLVQIGQFTCARAHGHLEDALAAAFTAGVAPREALEVILQCHIYAGEIVVDPALDVLQRVAGERGLLDGLNGDQLPLNGHDDDRDLDSERSRWLTGAGDDSRTERYVKEYGWRGISAGLQAKGVQHLNILEYRHALDPQWTGFWLRFGYQTMYSRFILDEKTRLLCVVGDCVALGVAIQAREHMEGALKAGASAREVMEVVQQSAIYFGFPRMGDGLRVLVGLMAELGRLEEIGSPPTKDPQIRDK